MVLPPVETTPVLVIRFAAKTSDRLIDLVKQRLKKGGLVSLQRIQQEQQEQQSKDDTRTLLRLTTTQQLLEETAEHIHLMKLTAETKIIEYFTVADRLRFCCQTQKESSHNRGKNVDTDTTPLNLDKYGLFNSNEWSLLILHILDTITVLVPSERSSSSELSQILDDVYHADYHVHSYDDDDKYNSKTDGTDGNSRKSSSLRKTKLQKHGEQSACLRHVLETYRIVDLVTFVHLPKLRQEILDRTWWPWYQMMPPVDLIQNYYGWEVAFYFAWMGFLTQWLLFPGILGLLFWYLRWYRNDTIDEDEYTPFYGLITFIWGVLFLRFWQRHEHRLAYQWGTESLTPYERQKYFAIRPEFRGYLRKSPVTGLIETFYPPIRRRLKYLGSALATSAMLLVAFAVMILSLNLQGYIHPQTHPKRGNEESNQPHPFHVRSLAVLAEEGRLFDAKSSWRGLIPVVLHVICIFTLNGIYRGVAAALTAWENHETTLNHRNSLILKRFLFEAFDCYVALFYLAFYERDVDRLRLELIAVFQIDTLRRVLLECIVPMLLQRISAHRSKREQQQQQKETGTGYLRTGSSSLPTAESIAPTDSSILEDLDKDEYEQFDDYMEIVIQLGYVTLFASAYPLASLISIAANWVETRTDCFKISKVCRRPESFRSSSLGMWRTLMASVIWMSALTNCLIAGFTSAQLTHYLPGFYIRDETGDNNSIDHEDGWMVVFVIFGLERLLLVAGMLVFAVVPAIPEDVADELERRQYIRAAQQQQQRLNLATSNAVTSDKNKDD